MKKSLIFTGLFIFIIGGFLFISNDSKTFDLTEKFSIQGNVIEHGKFQEKDYDSIVLKLQDLYEEEKNSDEQIYFIFGNKEKIYVTTYKEIAYGKLNVNLGGKTGGMILRESNFLSEEITPKGNEIDILIGGDTYNFKLKDEENIYFILMEEEK